MIGPQDAEVETPERVPSALSARDAAPHPGDGRPPAPPARRTLPRLHRVDHSADPKRPQHRGPAADVVPVRVRDDDRRQPVEPQTKELPVDARLGRAGVDEQRPLRRLEQDPVPRPTSRNETRSPAVATTTRARAPPTTQSIERQKRDALMIARPPAVGGNSLSARTAATARETRTSVRDDVWAYGVTLLAAPRTRSRQRPPRSMTVSRPRKAHRRKHRPGSRSRATPASPARRGRSQPPSKADRPELEPQDRRRGRCRRQPRSRPPRRARLGPGSPREPAQARQRQEDGRHRGERELESGLEQRAGRPGEQHDRPHRHRVPPVGRPGEQPGKRGKAARNGRPDDGRLPADGERVGQDRHDRERVTDRSAEPDHIREPEHTKADQDDVLAGHGQQVVEPRRLEGVAELGSMPSSAPSTTPTTSDRRSPVVPSDRALPISVRSRSPTPPIPPRRPTTCQGPLACRTTWTPRRSSHPRSSKPVSGPRGATGRARRSSTAPCGGARPAGSSSSTRSRSSTPSNRRTSAATRTAKGETLAAPGDDDLRPGGLADARRRGSCGRARAAGGRPTRARGRRGRSPPGRAGASAAGGTPRPPPQRPRRARKTRERDPVRRGEPEPHGSKRDRRPAAVEQLLKPAHGVTRSRSCSTRAGPMPGIASRSSTERSGPWVWRQSRIFCAVTGPIPGKASSCSIVALARLTFVSCPPQPLRRLRRERRGWERRSAARRRQARRD